MFRPFDHWCGCVDMKRSPLVLLNAFSKVKGEFISTLPIKVGRATVFEMTLLALSAEALQVIARLTEM